MEYVAQKSQCGPKPHLPPSVGQFSLALLVDEQDPAPAAPFPVVSSWPFLALLLGSPLFESGAISVCLRSFPHFFPFTRGLFSLHAVFII